MSRKVIEVLRCDRSGADILPAAVNEGGSRRDRHPGRDPLEADLRVFAPWLPAGEVVFEDLSDEQRRVLAPVLLRIAGTSSTANPEHGLARDGSFLGPGEKRPRKKGEKAEPAEPPSVEPSSSAEIEPPVETVDVDAARNSVRDDPAPPFEAPAEVAAAPDPGLPSLAAVIAASSETPGRVAAIAAMREKVNTAPKPIDTGTAFGVFGEELILALIADGMARAAAHDVATAEIGTAVRETDGGLWARGDDWNARLRDGSVSGGHASRDRAARAWTVDVETIATIEAAAAAIP